MIGVVLWSDPWDRKAVIWCEDQGDLAFLNASAEARATDAFFDAGDLVQFDMEIDASMRRVNNARLVIEKFGKGLPDALRRSDAEPHSGHSAQIIPFCPGEQVGIVRDPYSRTAVAKI